MDHMPRTRSFSRSWKYRHEADHLRRLLDAEIHHRKQLEALLAQHNIDASLARQIVLPTADGASHSHAHPHAHASQDRGSTSDGRVLDEIYSSAWESDLRQALKVMAETLWVKPGVEVRFRHVTWSIVSKMKSREFPTVGSKFLSMMKSPFKRCCFPPDEMVTTNILRDVTGVLKPGQMTLVLGRPGSGKSSFLKMIAQDLPKTKSYSLTGHVTYNGDEPGPDTFCVKRVVAYIQQHDTHLPTLTVGETVMFAYQMQDDSRMVTRTQGTSDVARLKKMVSQQNLHVKRMLQLLGLEHVKDTLVGDDMIRGVSGGQRKRVTLCEMMIGNFRVLLGDQISTGLDSSTTFDICRAIRLGTDELKLTTVLSLLQPPPEVFNLFDEVILMDQGQIVFMGPRESVMPHFTNLGFECPAHQDPADFLQEVTAPEGQGFWKATDEQSVMPRTCIEFVHAFHQTKCWKDMDDRLQQQPAPKSEWHPEDRVRYLQSWWTCTMMLTKRQLLLIQRNKKLTAVQLGQSTMLGLVVGSLYFQLGADEYANMYGLFFFTAMVLAVGGLPGLPNMCNERTIFYKQQRSAFFPSSSFAVAQAIANLPINIFQAFMFGSLVYWMCGLSDNVGRYFLFCLTNLLLSMTAFQMLRMISSIATNAEGATPLAGCMIVMLIIFSGFIISEDNTPDYWIWLFWLNPVGWTMRSYGVLEFTSDKYDALTLSGVRKGDLYLDVYGFRKSWVWVWTGLVFLFGEFLVLLGLTAFLLEKVHAGERQKPPVYGDIRHLHRLEIEMTDAAAAQDAPHPSREQDRAATTTTETAAQQDVDKQSSAEDEPMELALPFTPAVLTFSKVWYSVRVQSQGNRNAERLDLLQGVSGYARPGEMTALMGSSGAGKTTLLDVIAGRKTGGQIRGDIRINGFEKDKSFASLSGYVEQTDIHSPHSTVIESLMFSARLRLPGSVDGQVRNKFVREVCAMLELDPLLDSIVGKEGESGLTTEQRKRLTIGVELVANPSIIFLDEPTSGLDSRAAAIVMRVVRNIAATKRTIICTIHQPSAYLFKMFDNLLLMKKGGRAVYFGPLGEDCADLIQFMESIPGAPKIQLHANPATYMLEVIGAGTTGNTQLTVDPAQYYEQSSLSGTNIEQLQQLMEPVADMEKMKHSFAASYYVQSKALIIKAFRSYWRSPNYNVTRTIVGIVVAFVFGSIYKRSKLETQADVISRFSIIFVACIFTALVYVTSVIETIVTERAVFYRERAANMYSTIPYTVSFTVAEIPYILANTLIFSVVFYFTVGLDNDSTKFGYFWLFYTLIISNATFAGQLFACLVPDSQTASVIALLFIHMWAGFCGFMLSPADIPDYWNFMYWLSPFHYLMEGMVTTQFHNENKMIDIVTKTGVTKMRIEDYVHIHFGKEFKFSNRVTDIIALIVFVLGWNVLRAVALKYLNTLNR